MVTKTIKDTLSNLSPEENQAYELDTEVLVDAAPANQDRNRYGQFKPGVSGNPSGRPAGEESLQHLVKRRGNQTLPDGRTYLQALADILWENATGGDFRFAQELYNRLEGKVSDQVEVTDKTEALLEELARNRRGDAE